MNQNNKSILFMTSLVLGIIVLVVLALILGYYLGNNNIKYENKTEELKKEDVIVPENKEEVVELEVDDKLVETLSLYIPAEVYSDYTELSNDDIIKIAILNTKKERKTLFMPSDIEDVLYTESGECSRDSLCNTNVYSLENIKTKIKEIFGEQVLNNIDFTKLLSYRYNNGNISKNIYYLNDDYYMEFETQIGIPTIYNKTIISATKEGNRIGIIYEVNEETIDELYANYEIEEVFNCSDTGICIWESANIIAVDESTESL